MEREVDKVVTKFSTFNDNTAKIIDEQIANIEKIRKDLANTDSEEGGESTNLTSDQRTALKDISRKVSECVGRVATDHRDLHSTVSKVGKAIDRNFVADFDSTSRDDVFSGPTKEQLLNEVILQHFYRQVD